MFVLLTDLSNSEKLRLIKLSESIDCEYDFLNSHLYLQIFNNQFL